MASSTRTSAADICKGMTAGAVAGLAAAFVMTRFHQALSGGGVTGAQEPQSDKPVEGTDDAPMKAADQVAQMVAGRHLTHREKTQMGGPAMHYAFGAVAGALYGAMREVKPGSPFASGGPYGAAVWIAADQLGLPVTGLSPWPLRSYPAATNARHFASHLVYGWTVANTYRVVRGML
jgi:putative membrane protein